MKPLPKNTTIPLLLLLTLIFTLTIFEGLNHYARTAPGGVDFLVHWIANRHLLQGESPYSENVTLEIQQWVYGRPARLHEHQQRDVYPLYAVVMFAPFTTIHDFATARAAWTTLLFLSIVGVLGLSLALLHWRPQPWLLGLLTFFALTWYHNVRLLINGNATGVVALLQMLAVWLLSKNRRHSDVAAGLALALSTFKPNLALLPFLWLNGWDRGVDRLAGLGLVAPSAGRLPPRAVGVCPHPGRGAMDWHPRRARPFSAAALPPAHGAALAVAPPPAVGTLGRVGAARMVLRGAMGDVPDHRTRREQRPAVANAVALVSRTCGAAGGVGCHAVERRAV